MHQFPRRAILRQSTALVQRSVDNPQQQRMVCTRDSCFDAFGAAVQPAWIRRGFTTLRQCLYLYTLL